MHCLAFLGSESKASRSPSRSSAIVKRVVGTSLRRRPSSAACTDQASTHPALASEPNASGVGPTVEIVTLEREIRKRESSPNVRAATTTASALSAGSPIPMKTTPSSGGMPSSRHTCRPKYVCNTISSAVSERSLPIFPVAQKVQACAQPTCELTQIVVRPRSVHGIRTVSTSSPSDSRTSSLTVPSRVTVCSEREPARVTPSPASASMPFVFSVTLDAHIGSSPARRQSQTIDARPLPPRISESCSRVVVSSSAEGMAPALCQNPGWNPGCSSENPG
mmetsp:Transcript_11479/g.29071  ORF Transcript_11479/g.29071 Transcript_11479/m.29071 type:complete len:278 (-) Transcript_11479:521-1354(-)